MNDANWEFHMEPKVPMAMRIIAAILLCYGAYTMWLVAYSSIWFLLWSVPCLVGAVGLALSLRWSQYVYYLVATCTVLGWASFFALYAVPAWASLEPHHIVKLFVLGFVLISFSIWSGTVVYRHFQASGKQI